MKRNNGKIEKPKPEKSKVRHRGRRHRARDRNPLAKSHPAKYILVPVLIVMGMLFAYFFWFNIHTNNVQSQVEYVKQYYKNGKMNDWQGKLGCDGIEDIKWMKDDKYTELIMGRVTMKWENDRFLTKSNLDLISQIGFEVKYSKSAKDIKVFWNGMEVERYVTRR